MEVCITGNHNVLILIVLTACGMTPHFHFNMRLVTKSLLIMLYTNNQIYTLAHWGKVSNCSLGLAVIGGKIKLAKYHIDFDDNSAEFTAQFYNICMRSIP